MALRSIAPQSRRAKSRAIAVCPTTLIARRISQITLGGLGVLALLLLLTNP